MNKNFSKTGGIVDLPFELCAVKCFSLWDDPDMDIVKTEMEYKKWTHKHVVFE